LVQILASDHYWWMMERRNCIGSSIGIRSLLMDDGKEKCSNILLEVGYLTWKNNIVPTCTWHHTWSDMILDDMIDIIFEVSIWCWLLNIILEILEVDIIPEVIWYLMIWLMLTSKHHTWNTWSNLISYLNILEVTWYHTWIYSTWSWYHTWSDMHDMMLLDIILEVSTFEVISYLIYLKWVRLKWILYF